MTEPLLASPVAAGHPPVRSALGLVSDAARRIDSAGELLELYRLMAQVACDVTGAAFAGLVLLASDGQPVHCSWHGLPDDQQAGMTALVAGDRSSRAGAADRATSTDSVSGLRSFAVAVRSEPAAELYLPRSAPLFQADVSGRAGGAAADGTPAVDVLDALLGMLGNKLHAAHLAADARRSKDWLAASGAIARGLLAGEEAEATLRGIVERACRVADADFCSMLLPRPDGMLEVAITTGIGADDYRGRAMDPAASRLAAAAAAGAGLTVRDFDEIKRVGFDNPYHYGPVMLAPIADADGVRGSVVLGRLAGRAPFTPRDLDLARIFGDQVALALQMDEARSQGAWLPVLEVRHRIARDLHDNVMQRLFATGVRLQSLTDGALPADVARRLEECIGEFDETIDEIRERVFGLQDNSDAGDARPPARFPYVQSESGGPDRSVL